MSPFQWILPARNLHFPWWCSVAMWIVRPGMGILGCGSHGVCQGFASKFIIIFDFLWWFLIPRWLISLILWWFKVHVSLILYMISRWTRGGRFISELFRPQKAVFPSDSSPLIVAWSSRKTGGFCRVMRLVFLMCTLKCNDYTTFNFIGWLESV